MASSRAAAGKEAGRTLRYGEPLSDASTPLEDFFSVLPRGYMTMDGFQKVGQVEDVPPGQSKIVKVNDRPIALFNIDGKFYAIHNSCPHEGGPLIEGRLKGYVIACPWHDLAFDIRNGQGTDGGGYCVGSYEVRVEENEIMIGPRRKT